MDVFTPGCGLNPELCAYTGSTLPTLSYTPNPGIFSCYTCPIDIMPFGLLSPLFCLRSHTATVCMLACSSYLRVWVSLVCSPGTAPSLLGTATHVSVCSSRPHSSCSSFIPCLLLPSDSCFPGGQGRRLGRMSLKNQESFVGWNGAQPRKQGARCSSFLQSVSSRPGRSEIRGRKDLRVPSVPACRDDTGTCRVCLLDLLVIILRNCQIMGGACRAGVGTQALGKSTHGSTPRLGHLRPLDVVAGVRASSAAQEAEAHCVFFGD